MGTLKPGSTYIYEKVNGVTYARELNDLPNKRVEVGRDYEQQDWIETQLWQDIVRAGRTNPALQKVLDRAKLIYQTIKDSDDK